LPRILYPKSREGVTLLRRRSGDTFLIFPSGARQIRGVDGTALTALWHLLDGTRSRTDLVGELRATRPEVPAERTEQLLDVLERASAVVDGQASPPPGLTQGAIDRYDRQIRYWAGYEKTGQPPNRYDCQLALQESRVGVIGIGGLGSVAALLLGASGVGYLRTIDPDRVELSNLNRQLLYVEADVGTPKVEAAGRRLRALNSALEYAGIGRTIGSREEAVEFVGGLDMVAVAADQPRGYLRRWIAEACHQTGTTYAVLGGLLMGPLVVPGRTPCFGCYEAELRARDPEYDWLCEQADSIPPVQSAPTYIGPLSVGLACKDVIHHLAGAGKVVLSGNVLRLDPHTSGTSLLPLTRRADCRICGEQPAAVPAVVAPAPAVAVP
jgi:bacteriocin biosynthesis cyclodehydratase domain-containing protein